MPQSHPQSTRSSWSAPFLVSVLTTRDGALGTRLIMPESLDLKPLCLSREEKICRLIAFALAKCFGLFEWTEYVLLWNENEFCIQEYRVL